MYLLIATIFIAEIIIAFTVISHIVKADKAVKQYNSAILDSREGFKKISEDVSFCVKSFGDYYDCIINSMKKKQLQFRINLIKNVCMYLSLFLLKGKYKRVASFLQFAVLFHEYWQKMHSD